jgi:hypothetical protein
LTIGANVSGLFQVNRRRVYVAGINAGVNVYEEFEEIEQEAITRFRKYNRGARGQVVTRADGLDFWIYLVTKEKFSSYKDPSSYQD